VDDKRNLPVFAGTLRHLQSRALQRAMFIHHQVTMKILQKGLRPRLLREFNFSVLKSRYGTASRPRLQLAMSRLQHVSVSWPSDLTKDPAPLCRPLPGPGSCSGA
jgi:hypothetical protein